MFYPIILLLTLIGAYSSQCCWSIQKAVCSSWGNWWQK